MALNHNDLNTIRQYLLGQLAEVEQQEIEQRLLVEDDLFQELEMVEDELVDEYLAEDLITADRQGFEQYFLATPERQNALRFATSLHRHAAKKTASQIVEERSPSPPGMSWMEGFRVALTRQSQWFRFATVAAVLAIVIGGLWFVSPNRYIPQSYATVILTSSHSNRGESDQATKVKLPLGADALRLYLKLPEASEQATRFRVELLKENGETNSIRQVALLDQSAVVEIPAAQLSRGQFALNVYILKPDGSEQRIGGSYFLTVE
jgi:hypothetical protein